MATPKKLFPSRQRRRRPRIEIIPMVDVMFLLLVFYILSSLALHNQRGIPVSLPKAQSGEAGSPVEDFVVTITASGDYYLNKQKVPYGGLEQALAAWSQGLPGGAETAQKINVILNADLATQHQYVIIAMDDLRKLGVANFTMSTDPSRTQK